MKNKIIIGSTYFLICLCVYSTHNYMIKIIKRNANISSQQYAVLDMLLVVKFIGSFFWTNIGDRTGKYGTILIFGLMGYAFFLSLFKFAPEMFKSDGLNKYTYIYNTSSIFFLSSVFATMDTITLEYLENVGDTRLWYGRLKMASTFGHFFAHILVGITAKNYPDSPIYLALLFATLCSIFIFFSFKSVEKNLIKKLKVKKIESIIVKLKKNYKYVSDLLTFNTCLLMLNITLQGIHRQTLTSYLPAYYENVGVKQNEMAFLFALRCLPEAVMLFLTPYIEDLIGVYWMFFTGICFGCCRPMFYAFLPVKDYTPSTKKITTYLLEFPKGIFSALFGYAGSKILKEISTPKTRSIAQGAFNGFYSGFAPSVSGIIGYYMLEEKRIKNHNYPYRNYFGFAGMLGIIGLFLVVLFIFRHLKSKKEKTSVLIEESLKCAPI